MIPPSNKGHHDQNIFPASVVVVGNPHDKASLRYQVHGHINVSSDVNFTTFDAAYSAAVHHSRTVKEVPNEVDTEWKAAPSIKPTLHTNLS